MKIIMGLGNPGPDYRDTRHNLGFSVIDRLSRGHDIKVSQRRGKSRLGEGRIERRRVVLAKPQTYMNNSGRAATSLLEIYKAKPEDLLVVCDDFHLDVGKIRVRRKGSSGGQKGLASIINALGTDEFARLRMGIGQARRDPVEFVLSAFSKHEKEIVSEAVDEAAEACAVWVTGGIDACMNAYNRSTGEK